MRISKKYAGKSIGKQVFLSRLGVAPRRDIVSSNTEVLKQLEFQFHMSVLQEGITTNNMDPMSAVAQAQLHYPNATNTHTHTNPAMHRYLGTGTTWSQQQSTATVSSLVCLFIYVYFLCVQRPRTTYTNSRRSFFS